MFHYIILHFIDPSVHPLVMDV